MLALSRACSLAAGKFDGIFDGILRLQTYSILLGDTVMPLTDTHIRNARPTSKPYKLSDGGGMYLLVTPDGATLLAT